MSNSQRLWMMKRSLIQSRFYFIGGSTVSVIIRSDISQNFGILECMRQSSLMRNVWWSINSIGGLIGHHVAIVICGLIRHDVAIVYSRRECHEGSSFEHRDTLSVHICTQHVVLGIFDTVLEIRWHDYSIMNFSPFETWKAWNPWMKWSLKKNYEVEAWVTSEWP